MKHFEIYKKDPATGALYPEGQRRKKGLVRILEIVVRDFWQLLGSGLIATAAALPYGLCIMLFLRSNALGPLILSCAVTGALASVFGMNLLDTILRCLRDEAGFWSFQYKKALKKRRNGECQVPTGLPGPTIPRSPRNSWPSSRPCRATRNSSVRCRLA